MGKKRKKGSVPDSPFYRKSTMPVSGDDLRLGIKVGESAGHDAFPMEGFPIKPPSERLAIDMGDGTVFRLADRPLSKAIVAIGDVFGDAGTGSAVAARIMAFHEILECPEMAEWIRKSEDGEMECADILFDVAAYHPFPSGELSFDPKTFAAEVRRVEKSNNET